MTITPDVPTTAFSTAGTSATIHAQVAAAPIEECELLLLADAGEALVLNESAALLWQGIEAGEDVGTLTTRLTAQYDVPIATAEQDVVALLATLAEAGAIVMA
jgi:hypothetical protein